MSGLPIHAINSQVPYTPPRPTVKINGRVWSYRRIAPALVVLIACVIGVVCSLIWNFYLLIPFGSGFLASGYLLHIGCNDQELIALSENIKHLEGELELLNTQIYRFEVQNQKLKQTQKNYEELYRKFSLNLDGLSNLKIGLDGTSEDAKKLVEQLKDIEKGFQQFNPTTFSAHLEALLQLINEPHRAQAYEKLIESVEKQGKIHAEMKVTLKAIEKNVEHINDLKKIKEDLKTEVDRLRKVPTQ